MMTAASGDGLACVPVLGGGDAVPMMWFAALVVSLVCEASVVLSGEKRRASGLAGPAVCRSWVA